MKIKTTFVWDCICGKSYSFSQAKRKQTNKKIGCFNVTQSYCPFCDRRCVKENIINVRKIKNKECKK